MSQRVYDLCYTIGLKSNDTAKHACLTSLQGSFNENNYLMMHEKELPVFGFG